MAVNYQTIIEKDFSSGINKLAAEDAVPVSFVENLENMDPNAQGYVEKRKGYQGYAGSLPLRVAKAERNAEGRLFLYFDELEGGTATIDFSTLKSSPVILYGSTSLKPATTATSYYYSSFIVDPRVVLGTPTTLQAADVGATTRDLFVGLGWNYEEGTKNNEIVYADSITVNPSTFNVSVGSLEGVPGEVKCFIYINNHATLAGESWAATISEDAGFPGRYTVDQAIHQLNTQNYITRYYLPGTGEEIFPDSVTVTGSTIVAQFTGQAKPASIRMVIRSVPEIDVAAGRTAKTGQSTTLNIPVAADFAFIEVYAQSGSTYSRVLPDTIRIDDQVAQITFKNYSGNNVPVKIVWERANVRTNKLSVTDAGSVGVDLSPQLCLYGLDHSVLYPNSPKRSGWVTHIDAYKSEGENYLIAGLGWNLFKAVVDISLPVRQPLLRTSVAVQANVGPLFGPAGRDRKSYSFTGGNEGWANVVSIAYQPGTGWTRVVLSTPSRTFAGVGSGVDLEHDRLTIQGCSQKVHRGEWAIMAFSEQADTLTFDVMNPNVITSDYDEDGVGEAGCFTDKVQFTAPSNSVYTLHYGDVLEGDAFPSGLSGSLSCVSTVGNISWLTGVGERFTFPAGQIYTVRKKGRILQLRDINKPNSNPFENFVAGDILELTDRERRHRIQKLVPADVTGITVSVDGELGETTISNVNSAPFVVGQWILLSSAGRFSGEYQIKALPDTGTITLDSSNVKDTSTPASFVGPLISGQTVEVGYEDEFTDDPNSLLSVKVPLRWFPLENPIGSPARVKHFETSAYTEQPFVRSVMAQDNMYFANYNDHLLKYDGVSLYRSGLVRWQPQVFASADIGGQAKIIVPSVSTFTTAVQQGFVRITVSKDDAGRFLVGDKITISGNFTNGQLTVFTVVEKTQVSTADFHIVLNQAVTVSSNTAVISWINPNTYRYYFRLYALDANDNVVISAATGSNEFYVSLTQSAAIRLRLIGLPKFEQLNYSKIYLEAYRTKRNSVAPFYSVYKKLLSFDTTQPYIDIIDTISDEALPSQPDDFVATALKGEGIGQSLSQPPQAKYVTVANNSLILANIQDDPKIKVDIVGNPLIDDFKSSVFKLRKDGTSQTNDLTFELVPPPEPNSLTSAALVTTVATKTLALTLQTSGNSYTTNEWVYLFHNNTSNQGFSGAGGWFKPVSANGNQVTINLPYIPVPSAEIFNIVIGTDTAASPQFAINDRLVLSTVTNKYEKAPDQGEPGWDYYIVTALVSTTGYTVKHYSYFANLTLTENTDTANNPTGFVTGAYLVFNTSTGKYELAPNQAAPGINYYRINVVVTGTNDTYYVTHYNFPDRLARCSASIRSLTAFPVFIGTDYNYGWNNANNDNIYSMAARVLLRLSNAINFSQSITATPWCYANAGYDLGGQTLTIQFPENSLKTTPELVMPADLNEIEYYGNGVKVTNPITTFTAIGGLLPFTIGDRVKNVNGTWSIDSSPYTSPFYTVIDRTLVPNTNPVQYKYTVSAETSVGAITNRFPSRVVISYPNFAEVFDRPFDISSTQSESIVDVNPADGQEITGVFPFFSESTFSAALKSSSVIVFKSNSIYIIDPTTRRAQQIESNGLGCTAPYSIAATREGLMFANEAGLYRLTRSLTVEPIGSYIDRLWREGVNKSQLALLQGHAYSVGRKYKVSVPRSGESIPQDVLVYDYTREDSKNTYGSWTRYTNHAATGWCNLLEDAYFASTVGRVYKVSNENSKYDYQDDGQPIDGSVTFRALDFGDSAIRKRVLHLLVHYRIPNLAEGQVDVNSATVYMGVNLVDNYLPLDTFKLDVPNSPDGLSTLTPNKQVTLRYAVRNPKSLYFQVKIQDTGLHTPLQCTGLSFRVAGLSTEGIKEAAQTMKE